MDDIFSVQQVADYLGVSRPTVYRLMRARELPYTVVVGRRRVRRADIDALLAKGAQAVQDAARKEGEA